MDETYVKELFSDAAFVKEIFALDEPWEVQAALKGKGVEMSEEEIVGLRDELITLSKRIAEAEAEGGELSLEQLEEASGGVLIGLGFAGAIIAGITSLAVAAPMAMIAGYTFGIFMEGRRW